MSSASKQHDLPTLSKSALLLSPCVAWANPQVRWYDDKYADTTKRDYGTDVHKYIDACFNSPDDVSLRAKPLDPTLWRDVDAAVEYLQKVLAPRANWVMTEVAIGINWKTQAVVVLPVKDRQYPKNTDFQYGTADVVALLKDGTLWVGDWKTGGTDGARDQLMSLAYAFSLFYHDADSYREPRKVTICCLSILDGQVFPHEETPTPEELEVHREAMLMAWEDISKRNEEVPGIHCTVLYCPHLAYCKSVTGIVTDASNGPQGKLLPAARLMAKYQMTDKPSSTQEAGYVAERLTAAKRQIKYYDSALKDYVKQGGRVESNGYVWEDRGNGYRWYKA